MEYATNPHVIQNVGKTSQMTALTTLPQPVIRRAALVTDLV